MGVTNGVPLINGCSYTWGDIIPMIAGIVVTGITAIEYEDKQEVINHYGAGRHPVARGKGRIESSAKITLFMSEVQAIQTKSINGRLQDIAPFDIQVTYLPLEGRPVHDVLCDCQFLSNNRKWKEGDTHQTVELELVVGRINWGR